MRCCSSRGGRSNSKVARSRQLVRGDSEPADVPNAWSKKGSDCAKNGRSSGRSLVTHVKMRARSDSLTRSKMRA